MQPVPNQPVAFNYAPDCNLIEANWQALVMDGDTTQFQFTIDGCASEPDLVRNGIFTEDGGIGKGWTISPSTSFLLQPYFGNIKHIPNTTQGCVTQTLYVADGTLVQFTYTLTQTQGQCTVKCGAHSVVHTGAVNGTFTYQFVADGVTEISFCCKGLSDATWGQISLIPYNTNFLSRLIDSNGVEVMTDIATYNVFNGFATFSVDWESLGLDFGCYRIEVANPCECAQNGILPLDFYTGMYPSAVAPWAWVIDSSWFITNGNASYTGASVPDTSSCLLKNNPLCVGTEYTVTYTLTYVSDAQFRIQLGNAVGPWRTTAGTYTDTITCTVAGSLRLTAQSVGVVGSLQVTDLTVNATSPEYAWQSVPLRYGDWDECAKAIRICNDSDAMGMGFNGTGFAPWFRTIAHVRRTGYNSERNKYRDGFGSSKVYWGERQPVSELGFEAPEYIHDFVSLGVIADHFYVDSDEYEFEGDEYPTMTLDDNADVSGVAIPLTPKNNLTTNRRISSVSHGCSPDGTALGVTDKPTVTGGRPFEPKPLGTTDGQIITIDG